MALILFDTNIFIDMLNGVHQATVELGSYDSASISFITYMELRSGEYARPHEKAILDAVQMHDRRIRAAVIAAPALGFTFDAAALSKVGVPIQLWRAEDDVIVPHPWHEENVRVSLARQPEYHVVPRAGHFDFLAPCTAKLAAIAPQICVSQEGFDRTGFHRRFNSMSLGISKSSYDLLSPTMKSPALARPHPVRPRHTPHLLLS